MHAYTSFRFVSFRFVSFCNCQRDFVVEPSPDVTRSAPVVSLKNWDDDYMYSLHWSTRCITLQRRARVPLAVARCCSSSFFFSLRLVAPPRRRAAAAVALCFAHHSFSCHRLSTPRCYRKSGLGFVLTSAFVILHQISEMKPQNASWNFPLA